MCAGRAGRGEREKALGGQRTAWKGHFSPSNSQIQGGSQVARGSTFTQWVIWPAQQSIAWSFLGQVLSFSEAYGKVPACARMSRCSRAISEIASSPLGTYSGPFLSLLFYPWLSYRPANTPWDVYVCLRGRHTVRYSSFYQKWLATSISLSFGINFKIMSPKEDLLGAVHRPSASSSPNAFYFSLGSFLWVSIWPLTDTETNHLISLLLSLFRYKNKHSNRLLSFSKRTISLSYPRVWLIVGPQLILIYCYLSTYLFIDLFISCERVLCLCGCLSTTCAKQHRNPGILLQNSSDLCPTLNDGW